MTIQLRDGGQDFADHEGGDASGRSFPCGISRGSEVYPYYPYCKAPGVPLTALGIGMVSHLFVWEGRRTAVIRKLSLIFCGTGPYKFCEYSCPETNFLGGVGGAIKALGLSPCDL